MLQVLSTATLKAKKSFPLQQGGETQFFQLFVSLFNALNAFGGNTCFSWVGHTERFRPEKLNARLISKNITYTLRWSD